MSKFLMLAHKLLSGCERFRESKLHSFEKEVADVAKSADVEH